MRFRPRMYLILMIFVTFGALLLISSAKAFEANKLKGPIDSDLAVIYGTEGMEPDEVIIEFKSASDCRVAQVYDNLPGVAWDSTMTYRPVARYKIIDGSTPFETITRLRKFSNIKEVYPNYRRSVAINPNDPYFQMQREEINVSLIPSAWDITTGSNTVVVSVIDTGVDTTHPDLLPNLILPGVNVREDGSDIVTDDAGHGTAVCGILGAVGNNGIGVAGVSWNVKILPIRACGGPFLDCDLFDEIDAIDISRERGVDIINMSIGGVGTITLEEKAVTEAHNAGIVLVAAAGNANPGKLYKATGDPTIDRPSLYYPAALPEVIGVGAVGNNGLKADFSNYGEDILDLMAPGVDIVTTVPDYECYLYTGEGPPYGLASGTSFATPMVSGVAALILSLYPGLSPDEVRDRLLASAFPMEGPDTNSNKINDYFGYGILNAVGAISKIASTGNAYLRVGIFTNPLIAGEVIVLVQAYKPLDAPPMVNWNLVSGGKGASFQLKPVQTRPNFYIGRFAPGQSGTVSITISAFSNGAPIPIVKAMYAASE